MKTFVRCRFLTDPRFDSCETISGPVVTAFFGRIGLPEITLGSWQFYWGEDNERAAKLQK